MAETLPRVVIVGGGLAGLAAAAALGPRGCRVTVLESRTRLGGRASSFQDATTGQLVDACQHVSMGCCTNLADFADRTGIAHFFADQPTLWFRTPDGRTSPFKADPWPAPLHLGRALLSAHYLTPFEKLRIAYGLGMMLRERPDADPPLEEWLLAHGQTRRTIDRFWGVVLISALNETPDRAGLKYARKVFRDGFVKTRAGHVVKVPTVPLGRLYGPELRAHLEENGVTVRENAAVRRFSCPLAPASGERVRVRGNETGDAPRIQYAELRTGEVVVGDHYILAVPFDRAADLLPSLSHFDPLRSLTPVPITSVHLWYDRPLLEKPHYVLVDCLGQWVFARGESAPGEHYVQVVVSASRNIVALGRDEIAARLSQELARVFPGPGKLLRSKVVTEHTATFSAVPGVDAFRPHQRTPIPNLFLAGDYTATGWPATMEGAVRSGYLAAEAVLQSLGRPERILVPDL